MASLTDERHKTWWCSLLLAFNRGRLGDALAIAIISMQSRIASKARLRRPSPTRVW